MNVICPNCQTEIISANINVATDLAQCQQCHFLFKLSEQILEKEEEQLSVPPAGSRIIIFKEANQLIFEMPKSGFKPRHIGMLIFAAFWMCFITVWTVMASFGSTLFALFSIPFWAAGFYMSYNLWRSIFESQKLILNERSFVLEKTNPLRNSSKEISWDKINHVKMQILNPTAWNSAHIESFNGKYQTTGQDRLVPTVLYNYDELTFFENADKKDQDWIVKFINMWRKKHLG